MSTKTAKTAGQQLAATLRRLHSVGTRTRRFRKNSDVRADMLDSIRNATVYPGYYTGETHTALANAWAVYNAWQKHIEGNRINATLWGQIKNLSPWQTANLLGRMVDAGVSNTGEGERFFTELRLA